MDRHPLLAAGTSRHPSPPPPLPRHHSPCRLGARPANIRWSATGAVYLSNVRLVFVAERADASGLQAFDLPLVYISKEQLHQPIFGCNNLTGAADQEGQGVAHQQPADDGGWVAAAAAGVGVGRGRGAAAAAAAAACQGNNLTGSAHCT
jgi:hypothetical protein